jgi:hypothetical protein
LFSWLIDFRTEDLIFRASQKMKTCLFLPTVRKKAFVRGIKKKPFPFFCSSSPLSCHHILNILLNAAVSTETFKLLVWSSQIIFILCSAAFTCNLDVESLALRNWELPQTLWDVPHEHCARGSCRCLGPWAHTCLCWHDAGQGPILPAAGPTHCILPWQKARFLPCLTPDVQTHNRWVAPRCIIVAPSVALLAAWLRGGQTLCLCWVLVSGCPLWCYQRGLGADATMLWDTAGHGYLKPDSLCTCLHTHAPAGGTVGRNGGLEHEERRPMGWGCQGMADWAVKACPGKVRGQWEAESHVTWGSHTLHTDSKQKVIKNCNVAITEPDTLGAAPLLGMEHWAKCTGHLPYEASLVSCISRTQSSEIVSLLSMVELHSIICTVQGYDVDVLIFTWGEYPQQ